MSHAAALLRRLESGEKIIWWRKAPPVINVQKDIVAQLAGLVEAAYDLDGCYDLADIQAGMAELRKRLESLEAAAAKEVPHGQQG